MSANLNGLLGHVRMAASNRRIGEEGNETKMCGIKGVKIKKRENKTEGHPAI